jgi:vacuolar-type H+-ATPase subunit H
MANDSDHKSAAELQREIELQRNQVEDRIDQIQQKLSPGQIVDELMAYTKGGGGEFVSTLQRQVTANPLPVALLGVSIAWLMAKPASSSTDNNVSTSRSYSDREWDDSISANRGYTGGLDDDYAYTDDDYEDDTIDYPVTSVSGTIRRTGYSTDESGNRFSHFADDAGKRFRAATDAHGRRAGHFMDDAGTKFRGFTDAAGGRIEQIRDEAGNLLEEATNWASHTWQMARQRMHDARDTVGRGARGGRHHAGKAGAAVGQQFGSLNQTIMTQFRDQPLVGGALAFALGAALGSTLPHTEQEDALLGEAADSVKGMASEQAAGLYEQGRQKATEAYETASSKAGDIYQQAKEGLTNVTSSGASSTGNGSSGIAH